MSDIPRLRHTATADRQILIISDFGCRTSLNYSRGFTALTPQTTVSYNFGRPFFDIESLGIHWKLAICHWDLKARTRVIFMILLYYESRIKTSQSYSQLVP